MTSDTRPFHIGLLGCGTVGSAFAELIDERASEVERLTGRRPLVSGVLTRSRGDAQEIAQTARRVGLIVELESEVRSNVNLKHALANLVAQWGIC